jgi:alkanesulfonate monooxygenase SsuD/methylene tetrahydromethanopterin reductase-like flavin-dependent oxidoreductase (luciferase family)
VYEDARREAGFSLDTAKVLQLHWVHAGASDDDAWSEAGQAFRHLLSVYAEWVEASAEAGTEAVQVLDVPSVEEIRRGGEQTLFAPVIGSPETVTDLLTASMNNVTTTHLALGVLPGMDPKDTAMSMRRVIEEVAPQLVSSPARGS